MHESNNAARKTIKNLNEVPVNTTQQNKRQLSDIKLVIEMPARCPYKIADMDEPIDEGSYSDLDLEFVSDNNDNKVILNGIRSEGRTSVEFE